MKTFLTTLTAAWLIAIPFAAGSAEEKTAPSASGFETAVYAGGCFWCVESDLEKLDGVSEVVSGYAGGLLENPTYENHEGHREVVQATFDPNVISYRELTDYFLRHVDVLDDGGQFCDRGHAYTTAIYYAGEQQYDDAVAAVAAAEAELGQKIVTPVEELSKFWIAEDYHQDYYKKNPVRYRFYRTSCGRDRRVNAGLGEVEAARPLLKTYIISEKIRSRSCALLFHNI